MTDVALELCRNEGKSGSAGTNGLQGLISCSARGCNFGPYPRAGQPPSAKLWARARPEPADAQSFTSRKNSLPRRARGVTQGRALTTVCAIKTGASPLAVQKGAFSPSLGKDVSGVG